MRKKALILLIMIGHILLILGGFAYIYINELAKAFGYSENRVVNYKPIVRNSEPLPYDKWRFQFITPEYFYASISFVQFLDEDNYIVQKIYA
ncbi:MULTISPECIES: DUF2931 family protein [Xenorhabdus]|uniref:DUF2931 family protein n=1 Tax=Xenorhabdus TaxID=626 RepID=UPI0006494767|nr:MULTISPECIES: DUF2931 family protein [Xenorhabdus]KLU17389.1 hypothetical protein AAY47_00485 [Xenorhabdus griffiniae]KOP32899.1 hypothetical protein AFK69_12695 [Xenorhabdus sp. GDc328]